MLIDTHTHLYLDHFKDDIELVIQRAESEGVRAFYLPNIDSSSISPMMSLEEKFPNKCFPMMGLHPCSVKENYNEELNLVKKWLDKRPFCAVGEIGIDLYWDKTFFEEQKKAFITQTGWAKELGIPIIIHARESLELLIDLVKNEKDNRLNGIFHCFTGTYKQAVEIMDMGFYMGIGGVLTYKNAGLDKTLQDVPLDRLVLETDSPYLTPIPFRGKRNESSYIKYVSAKLAEVKGINLEEIAVVTTANAKKIFGKNSLTYTTVY